MILADTSVWIDHFRKANPQLQDLLIASRVIIHPFIIGELACGNLKNRKQILEDLGTLPQAALATYEEVIHIIETNRLWGEGIGWTDAHLTASALLSNCFFWTLDTALQRAAAKAGARLSPAS